MAEHAEKSFLKGEPCSISEKIEEKIHEHDSSSFSSDSDDEISESSSISTEKSINRLFGREKPVQLVLGGGKPADVFLWRNKKISAGVFSLATVIWILFELLDYHLLTLVSHGLILTIAILFLWFNASRLISKSPSRIPEVNIPEDLTLNVALSLRYAVNNCLAVLRDIVSGRDLKKFLAVIVGLWILSTIGNTCNFLTLVYIVFVLLHIVPALYEKYEDKVELYCERAMAELEKHYTVIFTNVMSKLPRAAQAKSKKHQ